MTSYTNILKESSHLPGKNHLIAIGIDNYVHCAKLSNAVSDARAFVELMTSRYQFDPKNVTTLFDEEATEQAITGAFRKLIDHVDRGNDNVLVYYSGHGHYDKVLEEGYWIPVTARYAAEIDYISYSYLTKLIKALPTRHTLFIVDSCYSGAMMVTGRDSATQRLERDPSRWMLASGRNEVVPDGTIGESSPFAKELLNALEKNAGDGMRVSDLVNKVTTTVSYNSAQTPIGRPIFGVGDGGGEFVFRPKLNEERDWTIAKKENTKPGYQLFAKTYPDSTHIDEAHWQIAFLKNTLHSFDAYLDQHPHGAFSDQALAMLDVAEEEKTWQEARRQDSLSAYRAFVIKYPDRTYAAAAHTRIRELRERSDSRKDQPSVQSEDIKARPPLSSDVSDAPEAILHTASVLESSEPTAPTTELDETESPENTPGKDSGKRISGLWPVIIGALMMGVFNALAWFFIGEGMGIDEEMLIGFWVLAIPFGYISVRYQDRVANKQRIPLYRIFINGIILGLLWPAGFMLMAKILAPGNELAQFSALHLAPGVLILLMSVIVALLLRLRRPGRV